MELDLFAQAATYGRYLHRKFPMVPAGDIAQEINMWVLTHPHKVEEYDDGTAHGRNKLLRAMNNEGYRYCQREKAAMLGYKPEDNYYYELGLIRDVLGLIWDEEAWTNPPQPVEQSKVKHKAVNEGNNYVTTLADVSRVVALLSPEEQSVLRRKYYLGDTSADIAADFGTSPGAVDARVNRLVRRLQRLLGGERPDNGSGNDDV